MIPHMLTTALGAISSTYISISFGSAMLLPPVYPTAIEVMSGSPEETSGHLGRVAHYMDPVDPRWSAVQSPPYIGVSHSYTPAHHGSGVLTPISLDDNTYLQARHSPVLSHHSQEFPYVDETAGSNGLGITSAYQELLPAPTSSPTFSYQQQQHHHHAPMDLYGWSPGHSQASLQMKRTSLKRPRRQTGSGSTPPRGSPVRILPHPDGLHRLEQERRQGGHVLDPNQPEPPKSRPSGRGRRDPQAEEEDLFVENLRAQNLSWKIVAEMFRERFGKNTSEARLQMRMLRRRKSAAAWQEADITLLHEAFNHWQTEKYSIIVTKLQELGTTQIYTEEQIKSQLKLSLDGRSDDECAVTSPKAEQQSMISPRKKKRKQWANDE